MQMKLGSVTRLLHSAEEHLQDGELQRMAEKGDFLVSPCGTPAAARDN